jgi:hypothetical protein
MRFGDGGVVGATIGSGDGVGGGTIGEGKYR